MVRIRNLLLFAVTIFWYSSVTAQLIRKDHREMTPSEKRTYRDAVIASKAILVSQASHHGNHFNSEIHTVPITFNGTQFLSWHRLFIVEIEDVLRKSGIPNADKITIPYWDWRVENDISNITWNATGFLDLPNLNTNGFDLTRSGMVNSGDDLANATKLNEMYTNLSNFIPQTYQFTSGQSDFYSKRLEAYHNQGHTFIKGTMLSSESPRDPIFYLHHNFVDKLWQDWEDKENAVKSSFPTPPAGINDWPATDPNSITDARSMVADLKLDNMTGSRGFEVWFASNKKLLLDGLNGAFTTNTSSNAKKTYCYVAWNGSAVEGTIYAGDVQRDASDNIIADTKGGFIVDGAGADFFAGSSIELRPGFSTVLGSPFSAQIVDKPCGYTTNNLMAEPDNDPVLYLQSKTDKRLKAGEGKAYPNPFTSELSIDYNVETDTPLSIELVNALGQSVWQQKYGIQTQGLFNATIPTQDLPKGLYHVLIWNDKNQVTLKVIR